MNAQWTGVFSRAFLNVLILILIKSCRKTFYCTLLSLCCTDCQVAHCTNDWMWVLAFPPTLTFIETLKIIYSLFECRLGVQVESEWILILKLKYKWFLYEQVNLLHKHYNIKSNLNKSLKQLQVVVAYQYRQDGII